MTAKITTAIAFLCSAASVIALCINIAPDTGGPTSAAVSAIALSVAAVGVFLKPRLSYFVGSASGFFALWWLARIEFRDFPTLNSWIMFNLPDDSSDILLAKLRILAVSTVVISTTCALVRLVPANWTLGKSMLREKTWPALAICCLVIVSWYRVSVSPYRIPYFADTVSPELTMLHVEKNGIQFHETSITTYRDGQFLIERNDRKLLEYRFTVRRGSGTLPASAQAPLHLLAQSFQLTNSQTQPAVSLRSRNAEGWYIRAGRTVMAFSTENGAKPPREVVALFRDLESAAPTEIRLGTMKDVCIGFCYGPMAGLGFAYLNGR